MPATPRRLATQYIRRRRIKMEILVETMKRGVLLAPAFCALLFTNALAAPNAKDVDKLVGQCAHRDQKACKNLSAAIAEMTDQALLAKIVADLPPDWGPSEEAVKRMTDQALLARIAVENSMTRTSSIALSKLTDQALLAKIAVEHKTQSLGSDAVKRMTDQALLAKIAVEHKESLGDDAVSVMTDQVLLAKIALEYPRWTIGLIALSKLTDQALLAKIVAEYGNSTVYGDIGLTARARLQEVTVNGHRAAVRELTDQASLAKIAATDTDRDARWAAFWKLTDQALMTTFAGNLAAPTTDAQQSIVRIRLAIQEPRIRSRFPRIQFAPIVGGTANGYYPGAASLSSSRNESERVFTARGELVQFKLTQDGKTLAMDQWSTDYPATYAGTQRGELFWPALVHGEQLVAQLLQDAVFTQDDLAELSLSKIPEVRVAAEHRLAYIRKSAK
jgi:hypothetical protein